VRATVAKRDNIVQDDCVGIMLDTFNDKRKAFELFFNPLGIQGDRIITEGRGEDMSIELLMESKGVIHETGFNVEIAIPFESLRFEAGKGKLWGAHFFRRIKRLENELDSWMPFSRSIDGNLSQEGHLTGLEGISVERTIELIPSLTVSQNSRFVPAPPATQRAIDPGRIVNEPVGLDLGLTARFIPSSAVTVDLAVNPDFAQVEADQLVVTAFYADYNDDLNHDSRHPFTNQRSRLPPQLPHGLHQDVIPHSQRLRTAHYLVGPPAC
jgi:hypothetical protein